MTATHTVGFYPEILPLLKLCERSELVNISQLFHAVSQIRLLAGEKMSSKTKVRLKNLKNDSSISSRKTGQKCPYFGKNPTVCGRVETYFAVVPQVCRYVYWWQNRLVYLCVVIRIDTDFFSAQMESIGAMVHCFQFMVGLEVREPPQPAVDDVRKALFLGYL